MLYFLVGILSFMFTIAVIITNPAIQTFAVQIASDYLSRKSGTEIKVGGFGLSIFDGLLIENVIIKDHRKAVLLSADLISVIPGRIQMAKHHFPIHKIIVDHATFQLLTHKNDTVLNLQYLIDHLIAGDTTASGDTVKGQPWTFSASSVEVTNTRFHIQDENMPRIDTGMDFSNIDVSNINLLINDFVSEQDTFRATIKSLSAAERSGMTVKSMSGEFQVSPAFLKAKDLKLVTGHSNLDLDFSFLYPEWGAYNDFLNKVKIIAKIRPSDFDLQDVGNFAPILYVMKNNFHISGDVKGTVSNFHAKNFRIAFGNATAFYGNINANGLPNVLETFIDLNIKSLTTNREDIAALNLPIESRNLPIPELLKKAGTIRLKGNFTGFYNDFVANATLSSDIGTVKTDISLIKQKKHEPLAYKGQVDVSNLFLGELLDSKDMLGKISGRADINGKGFDLDQMDMVMNVMIDSVDANHYKYKNIKINGTLADKEFKGVLGVMDPNLNLDFNGLIDFRDSLPVFNFFSLVKFANLAELHLLERDSIETISTKLNVNFEGNSIDNIDGSINVDSTLFIEGKDTIHMDHLGLVTSRSHDGSKSFKLKSDFADADFSGDFTFRTMIPSMVSFIRNYLASLKSKNSNINLYTSTDQFVKFTIRFKETEEVMKVFLPFLRIAPDTRFDGFFSEDPGMIRLTGESSDLTVSGVHLLDWYIKATNHPDDLSIQTGCSEAKYRKSSTQDTLLMNLDSVKLVSDIRNDSIWYNLTWNDRNNLSEIDGFLNMANSPALEIRFMKFKVFLNRKFWTMSDSNDVVIDTTSFDIRNLAFHSGDQFLQVNGKISADPADTIYAAFNKLDISDLDRLLGNENVNLDGILSGQARLNNFYKGMIVSSDLRIDKLKFNGESLGDATFGINYDSQDKRFDIRSQILYAGNIGVTTPFSLVGSVFIGDSEPYLDFLIGLKNLNLKMVSPFVSSFMSKLTGLVSGNVSVAGKLSDPKIKGWVSLMRTEFKIGYLNVPYSLADTVFIDSNYFAFNNIVLYDSLGNKAMLNGKITHKHFTDIRLDLNVDFKTFSAFKNSIAQNSIFYGNARASGNVRISGPIDNIFIDVRARSDDGTHVIIPISSTADVSQSEYIIFVSPSKDSIAKKNLFKANQGGLSLDLSLLVNPSAEVEVFFPDQLGNIKASGSGDLLMSMTPTSSFSLSGIYTINKGSFLFQLKNYMRLSFTIKPGGNIRWKGDPTDADISLSAVYKTRVPMSGLTSDPSMSTMRIPVECIIRLNGKLMNPDITFGMDLPNAQEDIKQTVYTAIDTTNQSEMAQQVINILVLNQFKQVQGGTASNVNVGSTSLSIVSNQVNSMLSKISKNVNVGINYQRSTGTEVSQEFDVAVSTTLFSDRLLVDGLFGVNSYTQSGTTTAQQVSTIVGDINIDYLLTKNGRLRLKAFNRTNTIDILTNNAPYTQGIGISYQRDFNNVRELFKKKKKMDSKN